MGQHNLIIAIVLALMPVSEIRGAIPLVLAVYDDYSYRVIGVVLSIIANMVVPFIAYSILGLLERLAFSKYSPKIVKDAYERILLFGRKRAVRLKTTSYIALMLFVGIPLPFTGAWTGTLVSYILGLDKKRAIIAVQSGVLLASVIVLIVSYLGIETLKMLFMSWS